jgi:hypothetical protein
MEWIVLDALIPLNQDHCWDHQRWRWHADSADVDSASRWGAPVPLTQLAAGQLSSSQLGESRVTPTRANGRRWQFYCKTKDDCSTHWSFMGSKSTKI